MKAFQSSAPNSQGILETVIITIHFGGIVMPTYQNTSDATAFLGEYGNVGTGQSVTVPKYVWPLDEAFTLTAHASAPWTTLHAGTPPAALTDLARYGRILIVNETGDIVTVKANDDSENVLTVVDGRTHLIEQEKDIDKLDIIGSGGSSLYVYGLV